MIHFNFNRLQSKRNAPNPAKFFFQTIPVRNTLPASEAGAPSLASFKLGSVRCPFRLALLKRQQGVQGAKPLDNRCVSNIRKVHNVPSLRFLLSYLQTESTTEPKYWHRSNLLSPLTSVVLSKLQDNRIPYKVTKMIFNGEEKGGACARHLRINSNTRARQDYRLCVFVRGAAAQ